jgi:hypothetical protein
MQEAWLSSDTLPTNVNIQISCVITRYPPLESVPYPPHENAEIDTFSFYVVCQNLLKFVHCPWIYNLM